MYSVDERDEVMALEGVPQSSVGAPLPIVLADELRVVLAYYVEEQTPEWDGSTVRVVDPDTGNESIAIVRFTLCSAHMFGPPGEEDFYDHPLASRGLERFAASEVKQSSWIRHLDRNRYHSPESSLERRRHLIFTFHDSTFECICRAFDVRSARGSLRSVIPAMVELLEWHGGGGWIATLDP